MQGLYNESKKKDDFKMRMKGSLRRNMLNDMKYMSQDNKVFTDLNDSLSLRRKHQQKKT